MEHAAVSPRGVLCHLLFFLDDEDIVTVSTDELTCDGEADYAGPGNEDGEQKLAGLVRSCQRLAAMTQALDLPGRLRAATTDAVKPSDFHLVALAMQEPQYRSPGVTFSSSAPKRK